jgi:poly[(R)-3-hydroxyalkanoate] polymerase subunit PhaC
LILHGRLIEQIIDRGERGSFRKEILITPGKVPLAMVRKRWAGAPKSGPRLADALDFAGGDTRAAVLLIHGFGQNRYAWHLPSRSFANHLARAGLDVYNLDLRGHGRSRALGGRRSRGVFDYVEEDLPLAVEEVQRHAGGRPIFLMGHSLGGLVAYAAAPRLAGALAGIVSIGSPYHFARGSLPLTAISYVLGTLARARRAPLNAPIPMAPWAMLLSATRSLSERPLNLIQMRGWAAGAVEPHILDEHLRLAFDRAGARELLDMFEWAADKRFFGAGSDYAPRFEKLDLPLLVVAGASDDLAPPASVRPGYSQSGSKDKRYEVVPLGHIDLLIGRDAPLITWPLVTRWITKRAMGDAAKVA